ncbi:DeoR/GlpR family DNA-binding transcription regulator [Mucilaginibacter ginkgonis]|uniref:DeoR/GlpR transcriptional regulator n=1 Tax=Mucilaginibacter ginkgonis TaxID=2682091 RepID=A0A6I4INS3_9SPHI|nr:DeoR/GlpR family DNA-binding transcription regulator [Mucilaginibacter ginkgonis]QQL48333.1 DeoR/GlpR transcriptional regulator [Mucilaginibacter ginkgonis]
MLKEERLNLIMEQVVKHNKVVLDELSATLKVSTDTVRRDIKELSDKGLLKAVRGGAIHQSPLPPPFKERQQIEIKEKQIIAQKLVEFIKPHQVILIDSGTTTVAAAQTLPKDMPLTVITNSFPVATALEDFDKIEVMFIGGKLDHRTASTHGYETIEAIRKIRADVCLLGICNIDLTTGITGLDYEDSMVKRAMIETSRYIIALFTSDKIGQSNPFYIAAANSVDVLITEKEPTSYDLTAFKEAGILIK